MLYTLEGKLYILILEIALVKKEYSKGKNVKGINLELVILILSTLINSSVIIGATLIILGLYATLWGKEKEKVEKLSKETLSEQVNEINQEK